MRVEDAGVVIFQVGRGDRIGQEHASFWAEDVQGGKRSGWLYKSGGWDYVYAIASTQQVDCHKSLVNSLITWLWYATLAFTIHMLY